MKTLGISRLCSVCVGLALLTGCAGHRTNPHTANLLDDKVITERVELALHHASVRAFSKVHVDTTGAVVTLRGSVPDIHAKAQATQVAKRVQKVRDVENDLQVAAASR